MLNLYEQVTSNLAKHELTEIVRNDQVAVFRMGKPDSVTCCVYITFTPAGIALQGDLTPERNGTVSCLGYGEGWFAGELGTGYICEKFLAQRWVQELAEEKLRSKEWPFENITDEQRRELVSSCEDTFGPEKLYDLLVEMDLWDGEYMPGHGYDPREAAILVAIQKRFAELHAELAAVPA